MRELVWATVLGAVGAASVYLLVPGAKWWLLLGTFVFWWIVSFFGGTKR